MAPTYPECDAEDLARTLQTIGKLDPVTIFHEPINVRAENVARIAGQAERLGVELKTDVFISTETWQEYARKALEDVELLAKDLGLSDVLHLWPDKSLGTPRALRRLKNPDRYEKWLNRQWQRISHWPS